MADLDRRIRTRVVRGEVIRFEYHRFDVGIAVSDELLR